MNIAFGTILIFLILIPGIIFRRTYFHGVFSKENLKTNPVDELAWAIIPGMMFQVLWTGLGKLLFPYSWQVDFAALSYLLLAGKENQTAGAFTAIGNSLGRIACYNFSLWLAAGLLGYYSRRLVRHYRLDRRFRFFRYDNEWYYLLSGEVMEFSDNNLESYPFDLVAIDVLTRTSKDTMLYCGFLQAFYLSSDGGLSSIVISHARRRIVDQPQDTEALNKPLDERYYYLEADNLVVIPYKEILNINIRYVNFERLIATQRQKSQQQGA